MVEIMMLLVYENIMISHSWNLQSVVPVAVQSPDCSQSPKKRSKCMKWPNRSSTATVNNRLHPRRLVRAVFDGWSG